MSVVELSRDGDLAELWLNRPHVLNAADAELTRELGTVLQAVAERPPRVLLVRGAGRAFCSGIDRDMVAGGTVPAGFFERAERNRIMLEKLDTITIAALHGHCVGGGLQLAIACDIRIAASNAVLSIPAVGDGLVPGLAPVRLPRLIGLGAARRMLLTGETVGAARALDLGLVDHFVPAGAPPTHEDAETAPAPGTDGVPAFDEAALRAVLGPYLAASPSSVAAIKQLTAHAFAPVPEEVAQVGGALFDASLRSADAARAGAAWRRRG